MLIAVTAASCLLLGTGLACAAERVPGYGVMFERSGGAFLLAGLALIGANLPFVS